MAYIRAAFDEVVGDSASVIQWMRRFGDFGSCFGTSAMYRDRSAALKINDTHMDRGEQKSCAAILDWFLRDSSHGQQRGISSLYFY